jgi:tetratricopeptide (TPR) repeat protein
MRRLVSTVLLLLVCRIAVAQGHFGHTHVSAADDKLRDSPCKEMAAAVDDPHMQQVNWAVIGTPPAQRFFRQGLTQYYAFNYEEALRSFRAAAAADPTMPMASWGIALAAGPNINIAMDDPCYKLAQTESRKAYKMDQLRTRKGDRNEYILEAALIGALVTRYDFTRTETGDDKEKIAQNAANEKRALENYSKQMAAVWNDYQTLNANVSALYAESMIELQPWELYNSKHEPVGQATHIVAVLKQGIDLDHDAVGANHYLIHAIEGSKDPGAADGSAKLLDTLVPLAGHLVHMPSHIYLLKGEYEKAVVSNLNGAEVDRKEYAVPCGGSYEQYSKNDKCPQLYYGHYLSHNLFFGAVSATFRGQSHVALTLARETRTHVESFVVNEPGLQRYMTAPLMTLVMNRSWWAILHEPEPPESCYLQPPFKTATGCHLLRSMWYWARGMAHASRGEVVAAGNDSLGMNSEIGKIDPLGPAQWGNNPAATVLAIARFMLDARIAWANGQRAVAIDRLVDAVKAEDLLKYDEPPQWFAPAREALGGAYLQTCDFASAKTIFEAELDRHPNSGRALYGLMRARKGLGLPYEAVDKQFCEAWTDAEYTMTVEDLWPAKNVDARNCGIDTVCPKG